MDEVVNHTAASTPIITRVNELMHRVED